MKVKIILADDHKIVRDGLRALLEENLGMEVIAEASDGRTAVKLVRELSPQIVIIDVAMPILNGLEATRQIVSNSPDTRVIALSMHSDKRFVAGMLKAGASGYLLKDCAFEELASAIETVISGHIYLSPKVSGIIVKEYINSSPLVDEILHSALSSRELEVLQLVAEGKSTRETAAIMNVSVKTVETHRLHIMNKLNIRSVAELTKYGRSTWRPVSGDRRSLLPPG
ncbi:MAG: response regulator [bacterium]